MTVSFRHDTRRKDARGTGLARLGAGALAIAAVLLSVTSLCVPSPALAQQDWMATVATAPGGTLNAPAASSVNRAPTKIDPRLFPSPRAVVQPPRSRVPQGSWSPIVTGALPDAAQMPGASGQEFRGMPEPVRPKFEALSPVRPVPRQDKVAASEKSEAEKAAPEKSAGQAAGAEAAVAATDAEGGEAKEPLFKPLAPLEPPPPSASPAQQYCFNATDSAQDARFAWQAKKIKDMEAELDKRAAQLEAKTEEYKRWLERRDDFSRKAHDKLVSFYARMRPDAAALQLATVDEEMAAAVMMKLETKVASQILGEMDPERAAKIATIISGSSKVPAARKHAPARSAESADPNAAPPAQAPPAAAPRT
ncbi:MAG: MotE family protein [Hyphomicrobium sp.]|uniref:MotE family protein n=1 Tax=Hyphomicrobium sp. TaxID=82 RepID=UPI003D127E13